MVDTIPRPTTQTLQNQLPHSLFAQRRGSHAGLPSIFSTPPVDVLNNSSPQTSAPTLPTETPKKRKRSEVTSEGLELPLPNIRLSEEQIALPFREKLLPFIPALLPKDFQDIGVLIETELSLAYSICYVTARFLPGGKAIQEILLPRLLQFLTRIVTSSGSRASEISTFKAVLILYVHANCSPSTSQLAQQNRTGQILYWPLKSLMEVCASRLSLHSSIQDLKMELRATTSDTIVDSPSFQRYMYWLQLFIMSHYASIISGTPPSIRIDSTIRAAPALLQEIGPNSQMRLFGEVELCLIWEKASAEQKQLGEWWCLPDPTDDIDDIATEAILTEAGNAIDAWYDKWGSFIRNDDGVGAVLDLLGRYARFCISNYVVRCLPNSYHGLSSRQKDRVRCCVACANHVLNWPLNLRPIQKEKLRYVSDSGSIMLKFSALFIIAGCQTFSSCIPNVSQCLENVRAVGQLIIDLAGDQNSNAHTHGNLIIDRAKALSLSLEQSDSQETFTGPTSENEQLIADLEPQTDEISDILNASFNGSEALGFDSVWDFSILLPNAW
ncbi:hypothetical protein V499_01081 [Pseudogymnoascus sp. VKM F-103]|nr:hypothetical protein V499_01081 [Pseudogymnoascus sp. VKM F-103]